MLDSLNRVIAVLHASGAEAIEPVLLQGLLVKEAVIAAMADLTLIISIA